MVAEGVCCCGIEAHFCSFLSLPWGLVLGMGDGWMDGLGLDIGRYEECRATYTAYRIIYLVGLVDE